VTRRSGRKYPTPASAGSGHLGNLTGRNWTNIRSPPPGSSGLTAARGAVGPDRASAGPDRAPAGPDREDHPLARAPDQCDSAVSRMSARDDDGSSDVPASIWNAILCR